MNGIFRHHIYGFMRLIFLLTFFLEERTIYSKSDTDTEITQEVGGERETNKRTSLSTCSQLIQNTRVLPLWEIRLKDKCIWVLKFSNLLISRFFKKFVEGWAFALEL